MARYQLKPLCYFIDGYDIDVIPSPFTPDRSIHGKPNTDIKFAHIMDKSSGRPPYPYLKLNDGAAFIGRFITMGVDTGLIAQILESEYGISPHQAQTEVNVALATIQQYLVPRIIVRAHVAPGDLGRDTHPTGIHQINFKVNQLGGGGWKLPL